MFSNKYKEYDEDMILIRYKAGIFCQSNSSTVFCFLESVDTCEFFVERNLCTGCG